MTRGVFVVLVVFLISNLVQAAFLIEDPKEKQKPTKSIHKIAEDGVALRRIRRVGFGASAAGPLGFLGANLELSFTPKWGFMMGYGGGGGFNAFTFQAKKILSGESLLPYMTFGYARWYSYKKGPVEKTNPSYLSDQFLNETQKSEGNFSEDLIYPGFGLQFMQLNGPWAGYSLFGEVILLVDIIDLKTVPTATLGMLYYF